MRTRIRTIVSIALVLAGCSAGAGDEPLSAHAQAAAAPAVRLVVVAATASTGDARLAVDGNLHTRWESEFADPQWIRLDLGGSHELGRAVIRWETASSRDYTVEGSADGNAWTTLATRTGQATGARIDDVVLAGSYRYVRLVGTARTTSWGHSVWELELYGPGAPPSSGTRWTVAAATASSTESGSPGEAADQDPNTRWASAASDPQWIRFDLGTPRALGRVVLRWETASARDYALEGSDDGATWTTLATRTGMAAGERTDALEGLAGTFRYVRVLGTARTTGYGYSLWEAELYGPGDAPPPPPPPPPGGPFYLTISVPYVEYLQIALDPAPSEGSAVLIVQNNTLEAQVTYASGTAVTLSVRQSSIFGRQLFFHEGTARANPLTVSVDQDRHVAVELVPVGGDDAPVYNDPIGAPEPGPRPGDFALLAPAHGSVYHQDRRPVLRWNAVPGASAYRVYLNLTRDDYDFSQPGALLERYTLLGSTTATSWQTDPLPDRWTYRWYVEADTSSGLRRSENRWFSVYLPTLEAIDDGVGIVNGARDLDKNGAIEPFEDWTQPIEARVSDLMARMTPVEKAMQLFFGAERFPSAGWHFGPARLEDLLDFQKAAAHSRLGIPFVSTGDTTHGYVTSFPTGVGMAATRDPQLAYRAASMQRREQVVAGYRGTLGPIAEVGTKAIYPRIQEGGGEDADLAAAMIRAMITGYQGGPELNPASVLPTTKHWPGEGAGGEAGIIYDGVTVKYHMKPFRGAIEAGTGAVMPGYAGSNLLDPGGRGAGDSIPILTYLRENLGYDGLIMTDWLPSGSWIRAANAGSDVMGGADPAAIDMNAFVAAVDPARLDKALRRVLRVKLRLGILENPYGDVAAASAVQHGPDSVAISEQAAAASLTLLQNRTLLPLRLPAGAKLLVTGPRATDGESQAIWRSAFQPLLGEKTWAQAISERGQAAGLNVVVDTSLQPANQGYAAAIVCVGERSYTHGTAWEKEKPYLPDEERGLVAYLAAQHIPFVLAYVMPRPYVIGWEAAQADGVVVAYRPGGGGGPALARLVFGDAKPGGKLPFQLPRDMVQVGNDQYPEIGEKWDLPYDLGASAAERAQIRALIDAGQHVPSTFGDPLFAYGAGFDDFHLPDATPPSAPQVTAPTSGQLVTGALTFAWTAAQDPESGIQDYELLVDGAQGAVTRATTFDARPLHLSPGSHVLSVRARNWAEATTASATVVFEFQDTTPPSAPTVLAVSPLGGGQARVTWLSAADGESGLARYIVRAGGAIIGTFAALDRDVVLGNVARGSSATASSRQNVLGPALAVDGDPATRWSSEFLDGQWIELDLGATFALGQIDLTWENAYARGYVVETSRDEAAWTPALTVTDGSGGHETHSLAVPAARFVRLRCTERASGYGISLWELAVSGRPAEEGVVSVSAPASVTVEAVDGHGNRAVSPAFPF